MGCPLAASPFHSGHFAEADAVLRPGGLDLTRRALQYAGFGAGQSVVDLGCGEAVGTELLRRTGCLSIGVDLSMRALATAVSNFAAGPRRASGHAALSLVAADAAQLPFDDESLDGMLAECSLSLTGFARAVLAECHRVLRPGARLAITDIFARASDADSPALLAGCIASSTGHDEIVARLVDAGFEIERWEDHSALLKTFVARVIFKSGSLDSLWRGRATGAAAAVLSASLRQSRPGYFLLIASKSSKESRP